MSYEQDTGPAPARRLLLRVFPEREGRAAVGDLDEEYASTIRPARGRVGADLWYWSQVLRSLPHGWRLARKARRRRDWQTHEGKKLGMDGVWTDVRYALRGLVARPLFTGLIVTTLAVGIGATAGVFSVVKSALLTPLPYQEPGELVEFWSKYSWTNPEFLMLRDDFRGFESVFAYTTRRHTVPDPDGGPARALNSVETTAEMFSTLGVPALLGRTFQAGEDALGAEPVAMISHDLWSSAFGQDPTVVGRPIELSGVSHTVVGVLPAGFWFPDPEHDLFVARPMDPENSAGNLMLVGRLEEGRRHDAMDAELGAITRVLDENFEYRDSRWSRVRNPHLDPLGEALLGQTRPALYLALGATGLILLMACANVAALLLGRLRTRQGELAVRSALGAGRGRLARQLVTESLVLGLLSGVLGAAVAAGTFEVLLANLPLLPGLAASLTVDWTVFGAAMAVAVAAGLAVGLGPLAVLFQADLRGAMTGRGGEAGRGPRDRIESTLVVAEVALAVTLVTDAGLLIQSVRHMQSLDPGFDPAGVVTLDVIQGSGDFSHAERAGNLVELARRTERLPGVVSAASIQMLPLRSTGWNFGLDIEGRSDVDESTLYRMVTPGYFETMGIQVIKGRGFRDSDAVDDPPVVVVNRAFEERYFPDQEILGRRINTGVDDRWATIVGVVEDVRIGGIREPIRPGRYVLSQQLAYTTDQHTLVVRSSVAPETLIPNLRRLVGELDSRIALGRVADMEARVVEAMGEVRQLMILLSLLGGLALVLGAVGTYGVASHWVTRRHRTWGVLLALGVSPAQVVTRVLKRGGSLVLLGVFLGTVGAVLGARTLQSFLFEVAPTDPGILVLASSALVLSGLLAVWIPARRASRTDPLTVLREE